MGYATTDLDTPDKILYILKREFGKHEKSARHLHQFKQETTEKESRFAGRIRRYVKNMAISEYEFDYYCIEFLKIASILQIQSCLYQHNPRTFSWAIRIAVEAENDRPAKSKNKETPLNNINESSAPVVKDNSKITNSIKELCAHIQQLTQQQQHQHKDRNQGSHREKLPNTGIVGVDGRIGYGVRGACFVCHQTGHSYVKCFKASPQDRHTILEL